MRYRPETELIIQNQIKSTIALKIKGKKLGQSHNPQKAHLHPLRNVCVQYENKLANALRDIVWILNLSSAIN